MALPTSTFSFSDFNEIFRRDDGNLSTGGIIVVDKPNTPAKWSAWLWVWMTATTVARPGGRWLTAKLQQRIR